MEQFVLVPVRMSGAAREFTISADGRKILCCHVVSQQVGSIGGAPDAARGDQSPQYDNMIVVAILRGARPDQPQRIGSFDNKLFVITRNEIGVDLITFFRLSVAEIPCRAGEVVKIGKLFG